MVKWMSEVRVSVAARRRHFIRRDAWPPARGLTRRVWRHCNSVRHTAADSLIVVTQLCWLPIVDLLHVEARDETTNDSNRDEIQHWSVFSIDETKYVKHLMSWEYPPTPLKSVRLVILCSRKGATGYTGKIVLVLVWFIVTKNRMQIWEIYGKTKRIVLK